MGVRQLALLFVLLGISSALELNSLRKKQAPQFATSAADGSGKAPRPPGYRNAWDDCGGAGASATERMRNIAARVRPSSTPDRRSGRRRTRPPPPPTMPSRSTAE